MKIKQITRYIEKELRKDILREVKPRKKDTLPKITNERDLESSIYFHLRKKLGKSNNFKLATNYSVHGYMKKGASDTSQMMPDVVVLEWISDFEKPKINLMMELKIMEPKEPDYIDRNGFNTIIKKEFDSDFRKLNYALRKEWTDSAYFVYLYHSPKITQKKMENLIKTQAESGGKIMRFKPIAINKFESKISNRKKSTRAMIKSRHKARQLYSSRPKVNDDPDGLWEICDHCGKLDKIHTDRDFNRCNPDNKIKRRLSSSKRSLAAQKAARTKKRKQAIRKQKRSAAAKKAARTRKRRSSQ
jgi:hypothetical protein